MSTQYTKLKIGKPTKANQQVNGETVQVDGIHVEQVEPVKAVLKLHKASPEIKSKLESLEGCIVLIPCLEGTTEQGAPWFSLRDGEIIPLTKPQAK